MSDKETNDLPWDPSIVLPDINPRSYWQYAPIEALIPTESLKIAHYKVRDYEFLYTPDFPFIKAIDNCQRLKILL